MTASIRKITPVELRAEGVGFFVPCVQTGQSVVEGAVVGEVRPLVGGQAGIKVFAPVSGTIIAVRCYPTVHIRELLVRIGVPV